MNMNRRIDLADLRGVDVLCENDLHDLGQFVLSALEGSVGGDEVERTSYAAWARRIYGLILDCGAERFEDGMEAHGLPHGATLDNARDATLRSRPSRRRTGQIRRRRRV
jgi:hypothetical protein